MIELLVMALCLSVNAILSGIEMAFVSATKPRLRDLARTGNRDAARLLKLRSNPERTLSVLQVGITLVGVVAAAIGGAGAEEAMSPILEAKLGVSENAAEALAILAVALPYTYLSVVIGELVPKTLALRNPTLIALKGTRWLILLDRVFSPIVSLLEWSTKRVLSVFRSNIKPESMSSGEDSLNLEDLTQEHRQYLFNLFDIRKKMIRDIMLPWQQVITVDVSQPMPAVAEIVFTSGHTRVPVLRSGVVVGILNTKEFTALHSSGSTEWESIIRPMVQVQGTDSLIRALKLMQEKRSHLSIVFLGSKRIGMVTMEDIFEEIIGEIYDEDDDGRLKRILQSRKSRLANWIPPGKFPETRQ